MLPQMVIKKKVPFFFDLPVRDVSRSACDALRILCHGSLDGIFGEKMNERVDLAEVKAIKIPVPHHSASPDSTGFEYNLVMYSKSISHSLWDPEDREKQSELRALTQRVSLNEKKSHLARRILNNLFIKPSTHPVHFTQYEELIPHDHYVPLEYHRQLCDNFEPYLMRCPSGFPLVRSLFRAQGIDLAKRKFSRSLKPCPRPIITYTAR